MKPSIATVTILAAVAAICLTLSGFYYLGVAHAQSGSAVGSGSAVAVVAPTDNVLADPADTIRTITKLWRSGAITSACIVAAFLVLVVLRNRVAWFTQGWRAVWIAALIGGLGFLVDLIQSGATPNTSMIMIAVSTTLATALRMPPKAST